MKVAFAQRHLLFTSDGEWQEKGDQRVCDKSLVSDH